MPIVTKLSESRYFHFDQGVLDSTGIDLLQVIVFVVNYLFETGTLVMKAEAYCDRIEVFEHDILVTLRDHTGLQAKVSLADRGLSYFGPMDSDEVLKARALAADVPFITVEAGIEFTDVLSIVASSLEQLTDEVAALEVGATYSLKTVESWKGVPGVFTCVLHSANNLGVEILAGDSPEIIAVWQLDNVQ